MQPPHNQRYVNNITESWHCRVNDKFLDKFHKNLSTGLSSLGRSKWTQWKMFSWSYATTYLGNIQGDGSGTHNGNNPLLSVSIFNRLNRFSIINIINHSKNQQAELKSPRKWRPVSSPCISCILKIFLNNENCNDFKKLVNYKFLQKLPWWEKKKVYLTSTKPLLLGYEEKFWIQTKINNSDILIITDRHPVNDSLVSLHSTFSDFG